MLGPQVQIPAPIMICLLSPNVLPLMCPNVPCPASDLYTSYSMSEPWTLSKKYPTFTESIMIGL